MWKASSRDSFRSFSAALASWLSIITVGEYGSRFSKVRERLLIPGALQSIIFLTQLQTWTTGRNNFEVRLKYHIGGRKANHERIWGWKGTWYSPCGVEVR